ncbi:flagellar biosynthetic protein FliO [uncultured Endozoicomonas sp.]|uniref:flagellar biosynthetic protein FliO n=2 Tax=Endozoicomonas TaxID=305899 RepID=UPI002617E5B6|nr:flagellar biosynthetic protein FliO [uncultured Endozoicomonas sp.]
MNKLLKYFFVLSFFPSALWAEPEETIQPVSEMNFIQIMMPLLMVIALIFMIAWLVKRFNPKLSTMGMSKEIEILSSTQLSTQSKLSLIRVGGKDLLIGITPQSISLLKEYDEPVVKEQPEKEQVALADQFRSLLKKKPE